jgi:hypothetical protein
MVNPAKVGLADLITTRILLPLFGMGGNTDMKPAKKASNRTKSRFKDHSPFTLARRAVVNCFPGRESLFLISQKTTWSGWIPADEIDVN